MESHLNFPTCCLHVDVQFNMDPTDKKAEVKSIVTHLMNKWTNDYFETELGEFRKNETQRKSNLMEVS